MRRDGQDGQEQHQGGRQEGDSTIGPSIPGNGRSEDNGIAPVLDDLDRGIAAAILTQAGVRSKVLESPFPEKLYIRLVRSVDLALKGVNRRPSSNKDKTEEDGTGGGGATGTATGRL